MIYFLSSPNKSLKKERNEAKLAIKDLGAECKANEDFTISDDRLDELYKLIDDSDRVIFLIGAGYGSVHKTKKKSWTQLEIEYAKEKNKDICAIKLPEYEKLEKKITAGKNNVTDDELKQYKFISKNIKTPKKIENYDSIYRIICNYHKDAIKKEEEKWKADHSYLDLSGKWYSVHISKIRKEYLRIGEVTITQTFNSAEYRELDASAENFNVVFKDGMPEIDKNGFIVYDKTKLTCWSSDYEIYEDGGKAKLLGVFVAARSFESTFGGMVVGMTDNQYGVHEFTIPKSNISGRLSGTFRNAADPELDEVVAAHKAGYIYLFKDRKNRDNFILEAIKNGTIIVKEK